MNLNLTKQQKDPYIWNNDIKIKTKEGSFDYEEETKEKMKVKKYGESRDNIFRKKCR